MPEWPRVSIITPSLNQARYLPEAIESVLRQEYPNLEYVVVDGGSTDGSIDILKSYGERLRWISEPDTGQSNAINKGFRMATGDVVAWINADDVLLRGAVAKAAAAFQEDPDLGMAYGEGYIIDEEGVVKSRFPFTEPFNLWRLIHYGDTMLQQSVFMRRSAVEEAGYLDETLHWGLDWDLFIRLGKRFRARYIEDYLGCIREYETTKTATGGRRRFRELATIIRRHSGRRFAPTWFGYALELSRSLTPRPFSAMFSVLGKYVVWPYMEKSQGWHPDGWAGPRAHFWFSTSKEEKADLVVEGRLPQWSAGAPSQSLAVVINGRTCHEAELAPGAFQIVLPAPEWTRGSEVLQVDLIASQAIGRRGYRREVWDRKVSYLLDRVEIVPSG